MGSTLVSSQDSGFSHICNIAWQPLLRIIGCGYSVAKLMLGFIWDTKFNTIILPNFKSSYSNNTNIITKLL